MKQIKNNYNIVDMGSDNLELSYSEPNLIISAQKDLDPIVVDEKRYLVVVEWFHSFIEHKEQRRKIIVKEGGFFEYVKLSTQPVTSALSIEYELECEKDSRVKFHWIDTGDGTVKNTLNTDLKEGNIDISLDGLVNLRGSANVTNSVKIVHSHPNTYSDIKVRHLLDEDSKAQFEALSIIENEALYSKAFQDSKTILLSDDAKIKARPHLEILTDELEASHGAVTGGLDEDSLYYLKSRGIEEENAKKILIDAFCDVPVNSIENSFVKEWIIKLIRG